MKHESPSSRTDEWFTPPEILDALGNFDLDPCGSHRQPWSTASRTLTRFENGLDRTWKGRVWLNPPYGREAAQWLAKLAEHNNGIALIFARTETQMFFDSVWGRASAIMFLRGRIKFWSYLNGALMPADRSPAPSVLIAYGSKNAEALRASGLDGYYVDLGPDRTWIGWRAAVRRVLTGPIPLSLPEIYRAVMKQIYRPTNRNIKAKIRQTLYIYDDFLKEGDRWKLRA